ncbi:hypothetical protein TNCV_5122771 [Trichonephila clavipes]|nr:hypothetical protein TNCV_5122771 [Trichonephila clavipes]
MCQAQFSCRRMPDHRNLQLLYRQLLTTLSFYVTRHVAGGRRAVRSPSVKDSATILKTVADRPESSTRAAAHHISVSQSDHL